MDPHSAFGRLRQEDCEFEQGMLPTGSGVTGIQKTEAP